MSDPKKDVDDEEEREEELDKLTDIYSILTKDAKSIIFDLKGGVTMWREAAAGAVTSAGFIIILILTMFKFYPPNQSLWGWAYVLFSVLLVAVMVYIAAFGFRKYFQLRKKYASLFSKAEKL